MCLEQQFLPQQRVIVCCGEENDLGETVGHYGIVVQVLAEAKLRFPSQPQLWSYRVFIPLLDRQIVVPARQLVSTGVLDDLIEDLDWKICFDANPTDDNSEIYGSYRIPGSGATYFKFWKTETKLATYQLAMQIASALPDSRLLFEVPRKTQLTPIYVRTAIRKILGFSDDSTLTCLANDD